jgi:DNA recombination protein RmuC
MAFGTIAGILLGIIAGAGFVLLFSRLLGRRREAEHVGDANLFLMLQNQISEISQRLDKRLGESAELFQSHFGQSAKIVRDVSERLAKFEETNRQIILGIDDLKGIEDILKNPKQRGILGEYYLETLLKNVFPPGMYQMQYPFRDGTIVDAAIFVKDKIIPIDSKFSLENYNRVLEENDPLERERREKTFKQDLKNRIDETAKYVRPEEGTMDFAFMFIPAEGIYYDLLVNQVGGVKTSTRDLIEYAFIQKKVHIVSPTTFLAHLKMLLQGLRALKIEESAKEIRKRVDELMHHLDSYQTYLKKLGTHLGTAVGMYNHAYREFAKMDKDVYRISGERIGIEPEFVEPPRPQE